MPKAPSSSSPVKNEPYEKESPKKQRAAFRKGTWTEEMNRDMISHVLSISDIKLRYNWADLQKSKFPHLTVKQVCDGGVWVYASSFRSGSRIISLLTLVGESLELQGQRLALSA
jgi:hypothetical protein